MIRFAMRERADEENLNDRVEFIEDDYRNASGKADVFVSPGMLKHVGVENYSGLGCVIHRIIGDQGRGLFHFIGRITTQPVQPLDPQADLSRRICSFAARGTAGS